MNAIDARPQAISRRAVLASIWSIYREEAGVLLPAAVALFAIEFVVAIILSTSLGFILTLLFWVLVTLYQGLVVELVSDLHHSRRHSDLGALVRGVTPVLASLMVISILFAIGVTIGLILLIVPGLILMTLWAVVVPVEVLERPGVLASFGRSRALVRGNGWNVFGVIVLVYVLTLAVSLVAAVIAAPLGHVGRDLVQWAVNVLVVPVAALSASVLYFALQEAHGQAGWQTTADVA
ncbi:MAG: hypothetical protein WAL63_00570 [Solirubrobacteraceae bacterium]